VHLFRPEVRTFYNIERIWAAPAKTDKPKTEKPKAEKPAKPKAAAKPKSARKPARRS
jgi:hypothetical protein